MCHNKETSLFTFLFGCIGCILLFYFYSSSNSIRVIAFLWGYVLLMQWFEWLIWMNQSASESIQLSLTKGTMLSNLLQPVMVVILCILYLSNPSYNWFILGLLIIYISYMFVNLYYINPIFKIGITDTCHHLQYEWWKYTNWEVIFYLLPIITSIMLYIKPISLAIFESSYILITLFISIWIYKCGVPSIWCWMAAFAPFITFLYISIIKK